jgi:hypothetical protein
MRAVRCGLVECNLPISPYYSSSRISARDYCYQTSLYRTSEISPPIEDLDILTLILGFYWEIKWLKLTHSSRRFRDVARKTYRPVAGPAVCKF